MKTSIRLALTSLMVCGITFAASGAPLPFTAKPKTISTLEAPLPPTDADASATVDLAFLTFGPK